MVALGTHAPLPEEDILDMIGVEGGLRSPVTSISNHQWSTSSALSRIGTVSAERLRRSLRTTWHRSLGGDLPVRVNKRALQVDRVVIVGPTLPHEVAGFSGGTKYLFPGISGPEMIDVMHWLGALSGVLATIGYPDTAVRALIGEAAGLLPTPVSLVALVTDTSAGTDLLAGVYAGDIGPAWSASWHRRGNSTRSWLDRPYSRVISCPMPIYGELWTAAKAMYKLEAAVADGGELIIYAPGLSEVSVAHGTGIFKVRYHCLAYFLGQWDRFNQDHLAVLAHSTHVKGAGAFDEATGRERPRIEVKLATAISAQDCERLNLGYIDAGSLDLADTGADGETLVVPRSGEMLFRVRE